MTAARFLRFILLLSPALCLIAAVVWFIVKPPSSSPSGAPNDPPAGGGKLVVLVVFDQMRGDYLERWKQHFGSDGFEKMKREGVWYSNAHLPYAASSTAPGHASLVTGAPPSIHGIIENRWYDRARGKVAIAAIGDESYDRVPAIDGVGRERWPGLAPTRLLAPTVGDALKEQTKGSRVFSLSIKDRSAVMMGGKEPNGVYCFDSAPGVGEFHTSSYYRASVPAWVDAFDRNRVAFRWAGKTWDRLKPAAVYDAVGPDNMPGEGGRYYADQQVFPHRLPDKNDKSYFAALEYSAFGNELLWEFAKAAIDGERLGNSGTTDLLCVSLSTNDMIGHAFGPDSHEVLDITLRSDKLVGELLAHLDTTVGRDRYSVVVTADHGSCPLPEVSVKSHPDARRIGYGDFLSGLDEHLDKVYGRKDDVPGQWVERDAKAEICHPWIYLNRRTIESLDKTYEEVEATAANWLRERPTKFTIFTRSQLTGGPFVEAEKEFGEMARLSFHPDRAGDLYVIPPPYYLVLGTLSKGIDHGTPYEYDRHVPILAFGANVPKHGEVKTSTSSLAVAPILSKLLGIQPPSKAMEKLPDAMIGK